MNPTLEQILDDPESIKSVSDKDLVILLAPYYPQVRTPVLPESKSKKLTNMELQMLDVLRENKDMIEKIRKERTK